MTTDEYKYDVAFSFIAQDEVLATQLNDQFEGRLRTFIYSRRQEQLAGKDGEKTFNEVFGKQSRLVVVLYREGWGQTPWTRIEETAIRNRAYDRGYGFVLFIPLDDKPRVPEWLPRTQLWISLKRWGVAEAAAVIDARFQELGGEPSEESLEHRAARVERALTFSKSRENYLNSSEGVRGANAAFEVVRVSVLEAVPLLQAATPSLGISAKHAGQYVALLSNRLGLLIAWRIRFGNTLQDSSLEVSLWHGHPPFPGVEFMEEPRPVVTINFMADLTPDANPGWTGSADGKTTTFSSKATADYAIKWWLDRALKLHSRP